MIEIFQVRILKMDEKVNFVGKDIKDPYLENLKFTALFSTIKNQAQLFTIF